MRGRGVELQGVRGDGVTSLARELALHATSTDPIGVSEADIAKPRPASSAAGMTTSFQASLPNFLCASAMPRSNTSE